MRRSSLLVVVLLLAGGCGSRYGADDSGLSQERSHARAELANWSRSVRVGSERSIILVDYQPGQTGSWELAVGDNNKRALSTGSVRVSGSLPRSVPPPGSISWPDGTSRSVPLLSASDTVEAMTTAIEGKSDPCATCRPLLITGARLIAVKVGTSAGVATTSAWDFTLKGTAVTINWIAVDPALIEAPKPLEWNSAEEVTGRGLESATIAGDDRMLTVEFIGAKNDATQPCGADYTAEAVESADAAVIIVIDHPHGPNETCAQVGYLRTATVRLAGPLGSRTVLQVTDGTPVKTSRGS